MLLPALLALLIFPRPLCWGLIEARSRALRVALRPRFPRPLCWGLIEATEKIRAWALKAAFPRPLCWGLIEAPSTSRRRRPVSRNFPGHCAGASLKRGVQGARLADVDHFPGHCAGASLKRSSLARRRTCCA